MGNVDWTCLAIQIAITGIAFYLINMLILYKDDMNLFLSLLVAILLGYWGTTHIKPECKQESRLF